MNEINDLSNTNIETREITDLSNSEYENYSVTDLVNIPLIVGPQGPPNVLRIGEVKTGNKLDVKIRGDSPNQILDFTLEKGDKGDTGESGVYIGENEPEDLKVKVWIKNDGEADENDTPNNYNILNNKPKINNVELKDNKTSKDLGLQDEMEALTNMDIEEILNNFV